MDGIGTGSLVIVNCGNPREKMWGAVMQLDTSGVVIRGLDLEAVDDWLRQERSGGDALIGPSTFFIPMHRVVRIDLEESRGAVESIADRYRAACGRDVRDVLFDRDGSDE
jgi:hypothetical protein